MARHAKPSDFTQFEVDSHPFETEFFAGTMHVFTFQDGEAIAVHVNGSIEPGRPTLIRVHDECEYGDVLGSLHCDCGDQRTAALNRIRDEGRGLFIRPKQEGRGLGLRVKAKIYADERDTYEAAEHIAGHQDARRYEKVATILHYFGIRDVRLLTGSDIKAGQLGRLGFRVEPFPLFTPVHVNEDGRRYLASKEGHGHRFPRRVGVFGGAVSDVVTRVSKLPDSGESSQGGMQAQLPGGKGLAVATGIQRLGGRSTFLGMVGDDPVGLSLLRFLRLEEIAVFPETAVPQGKTPLVLALVDDSGLATHIGQRNLDTLQLTPQHLESIRRTIGELSFLVVTLEHSIDDVRKVVELAREANVPVVLHAAPVLEGLESKQVGFLVRLSNIVVASPREARALVGSDVGSRELPEKLVDMGAKIACIVEPRALTWMYASTMLAHVVSTRPAAVLDTAGSAAAFTAALVCALSERRSLVEAMKWAHLAGALSVESAGGAPSMPDRRSLERAVGELAARDLRAELRSDNL